MRDNHFYGEKANRIDKDNLSDLKLLLKKYGFPEISKVGKAGYFASFLIVQHATHDLEFMKFFLAEVETRLNTGEVVNKTYAYLYDRVSRMEDKPQVYGTQGKCFDGEFVPSTPISLTDLDIKRVSLGLLPMKSFSQRACNL